MCDVLKLENGEYTGPTLDGEPNGWGVWQSYDGERVAGEFEGWHVRGVGEADYEYAPARPITT